MFTTVPQFLSTDPPAEDGLYQHGRVAWQETVFACFLHFSWPWTLGRGLSKERLHGFFFEKQCIANL